MTSLIYKNFLFLIAALLNYTELIQINVFLFWCIDKTETEVYERRNLTICHSLPDCFNVTAATTEQKIRVCHENQNVEFLLTFLVLLNFLSIFAAPL